MQNYGPNPLYAHDPNMHHKQMQHGDRFVNTWLDPNMIPAEQMGVENAVMPTAMIHDQATAMRQHTVCILAIEQTFLLFLRTSAY